MDENTTTTTSSSAAAVADSANAAARGKLTATASTTTTTTTTSIKLLIKASNQQFDDQIIESDLLWTVKRLKMQISLVYPSKPPVTDQKLIYSGQLLIDTLQLKDVIRSYKDVYTHNHIFHLVYTPKNMLTSNYTTQKPKVTATTTNISSNNNNISGNTMSATTNTNSGSTSATTSDGLRQRHVAGAQSQSQQQQQQQYAQYQHMSHYAAHPQFIPQMMMAQAGQCPLGFGANNSQNGSGGSSINDTMPFSLPGQFNMQAMATHHAAMYTWMQQVYSQYMDQYTRLSNPSTIGDAAANVNTLPHNSNNPFLLLNQQLPFFAPNAAAAGNAGSNFVFPQMPLTTTAFPPPASSSTVGSSNAAQFQTHASNAAATEAAVEGQQQQQQQQQEQQDQVVAPRFPNIAQDEPDNRDWLDSFFSITRLAIFLTILYFNSSPLRCLVVVIIAGSIYLYHIGVLRLRNERNNNNINRDNNAAAAAEQIRQGVRQVQQAAQQQQQPEDAAEGAENPLPPAPPQNAADAVDAPAPAANNAAPTAAPTETTTTAAEATNENNNNSTSVISFVRTFVVTFFTSLLPETPAL